MSEAGVTAESWKDESEEKSNRFYWKGRMVSEAMYLRRHQQQKIGQNVRTSYGKKRPPKLKTNPQSGVEGRRIVRIQTMGEQMFCRGCKSVLSLLDIIEEKQYGLASIFRVKCRQCDSITAVSTDTQHAVQNQNVAHYDVNTKAAIGVLNAGIGKSHLNKVLTAMNIRPLTLKCYKMHEKEVGKCVEKMAEDSCRKST